MAKVGRNAPCLCGSGQKYKKCCGAKGPAHIEGLSPGIRMKGGVAFDPIVNAFIAIVHTWDNVHCEGEPTEWRSPELFPTEEEAMSYYQTSIRPSLQRMMSEITEQESSAKLVHRKLE